MALYLLTGAGLLLYMALTWFLASAILPGSSDVWLLRGGLWFIGILAAVAMVIYFRRRMPAAGAADTGAVRDLQVLIREAEARLRSSTTVRGARRLSDLGTFLLLGETGSAKTSVVVNSGLEPELMAGRAQQDGVVVPTETGNLWYAAGQTWVELPSSALSDEASMRQVVRGLSPRRLANVLGGATQPPRGVLICVDCAEFLRADAVTALTGQAKRLNGALLLLAKEWAVRLPVYVLFTKLDRLSYFSDFVRSYDDQEAGEPLGVTLSIGAYQTEGAYAQQQTGYLNGAFDQLFRLLASRRTECLRREHELERTPNVYEHPREMRKVRDNLVRYLVELCRPSQLQASPVLRGFYFTGVRPVIVSSPTDELAAPAPEIGGATQIFRQGGSQPAMRRSGMGVHRVAQWVYLGRFFTDVLLKDRTAQMAGGRSAHAGRNRRAVGIAAGVLGLLCLTLATVSFFGNRNLIHRMRRAEIAARSAPPAERLARLDDLRKATAEVFQYEREGAPLHLRWGLYPGPRLAEKAAAVYCRSFAEQLLTPARMNLASGFQGLRMPPAPQDDYQQTYDNLKAYLITTSHADKAELSAAPALLQAWAGGRQPAADQLALARQQFDFYLQNRKTNFCPASADAAAVDRARTHLLGFELVDRTYRNMVADVSGKLRPVTFADPGGTVVDPRQVDGAFTRAGWPLMQAAIAHAPEYYNREPWVLGDAAKADTQAGDLSQKLRERYTAEYQQRWQEFLGGASVVRYNGFQDAANKLKRLSGPQSALLSLFCTVSDNTKVDSPTIAAAFQPVHGFAPPGTCATAPIGAANRDYMGALLGLQVQVEQRAGEDAADAGELTQASSAKVVAGQTAQALNMTQGLRKLLEDPIIYAEALAKNALPMELNGKGAAFCSAARGVFGKFPFNTASGADAMLPEIAAILQPPAGRLWSFYAETLQPHVVLQGTEYVQNPGSKVKVSPSFLQFFNRAAAISRALFGAPPQPGGFTYTVQAYPSPNIESISLRIDGRTLNAGKNKIESQEFAWPGDGTGVVLEVKGKGWSETGSIPGPWAVFRLINTGVAAPEAPGGVDLPVRAGSSAIGNLQTSQPQVRATLRLGFTSKTLGAHFPRGFFNLRCESRVVR